MRKGNISMAVIRRMPKYYRYLDELYQNGIKKISSRALAEQMGLTASQIRQDFNCFGGFGQQGYGYNVETLREQVASIIGIDRVHSAVIFGVGNIGRALIRNFNFKQCGFRLLAAFDTDRSIVGDVIHQIPVRHVDEMESYIRENNVEVAILTIPAAVAKSTAERLCDLGIKGIWNFTNVELQVKNPSVIVENVHFSDSMMTLCYQISED